MDTSQWVFPQHEVLDIDRAAWTQPGDDFFFLVQKNGQMFIVQTPSSTYIIDEGRVDTRIYLDDQKQFDHLTIVRHLLDGVQLRNAKWLYLRPPDDKNKDWRLLDKRKSGIMYKMPKAPLWLPRVQESELQLISYVGCGRSICRLKGDELAVDIAWDPVTFKRLETSMIALKELSDLDLCFKPVAQVFRDGQLVGVASERIRGRRAQFTDKALFYQAMSELHDHKRKRRLYHTLFNPADWYIDDGKLRMTDDLWMFEVFEGPEISDAELARQHLTFRMLAGLFRYMKGQTFEPRDSFSVGGPLLLSYRHGNYIRPVITPWFDYSPKSVALAAIPRKISGVIRPNHLLCVDERSTEGEQEDDSTFTKIINTRKVPPSVTSLTAHKRYRAHFPILTSLSSIPLPSDDNSETIVTDGEDNETLVSQDDQETRGKERATSVSTMSSASSDEDSEQTPSVVIDDIRGLPSIQRGADCGGKRSTSVSTLRSSDEDEL